MLARDHLKASLSRTDRTGAAATTNLINGDALDSADIRKPPASDLGQDRKHGYSKLVVSGTTQYHLPISTHPQERFVNGFKETAGAVVPQLQGVFQKKASEPPQLIVPALSLPLCGLAGEFLRLLVESGL